MAHKDRARAREYAREYGRRKRKDPAYLAKFNAACRDWYRRNPEKQRDIHYRRRYGISLEEYRAMYRAQAGQCAVCADVHSEGDLRVDHNHSSGRVRSLLCGKCNSGIGMFRERPELFLKAVEYLKAHQNLPPEDA